MRQFAPQRQQLQVLGLQGSNLCLDFLALGVDALLSQRHRKPFGRLLGLNQFAQLAQLEAHRLGGANQPHHIQMMSTVDPIGALARR
ncbi:hypothetical protein BK634_30330 [Pseudomonas chlororaphis]|nr:hypothetical protein BK634_30330 [Pseudomonas chlororaphis]